jgi:hypothetical protein
LLLLCGFVFLLSSCDTEIIPDSGGEDPDPPAGELVTITFSLSEAAFGAGAATSPTVRSAPLSHPTNRDVGVNYNAVSITDDLVMYTTLIENEAPVRLRSATEALALGTTVRLVAYTVPGNVYVRHADYEVSPISHHPDTSRLAPSPNPLVIPAGTYRFVAYSLNNTNPMPAFADITDPIHSDDVLWGNTDNVTVTGTNFGVHITLEHKFAQITLDAEFYGDGADNAVIFTCDVSLPGIEAYDPGLVVSSGELVVGGNTKIPAVFTHHSFDPNRAAGSNHAWISYPLYLYTHHEADTDTIRLTFGSIMVNGTTHNGPFYTFFTKRLEPGKSYRLHVFFESMFSHADILFFGEDGTLCVGRWADGNITPDNIAYFKFGGVVGFTANTTTWNNNLPFNPIARTQDWNITQYDTGSGNNNGGVPRIENRDSDGNFTTVSSSTYHTWSNVRTRGKGDPCKLVGLKGIDIRVMSESNFNAYDSGWRLPTFTDDNNFVRIRDRATGEINILNEAGARYWDPHTNTTTGFVQNGGWFPIPGTRALTTGRTVRNQNPNGFLPAAGEFSATGVFSGAGVFGHYMSGEVTGADGGNSSTAFVFRFDGVQIEPNSIEDFFLGRTVRCVKTGSGPYNNYGVSIGADWDNGGQIGGTNGEGDVVL